MSAVRVVHWYPNFLTGGGVANAVLLLANAQAELGLDAKVVCATASGPALYGAREPEAAVEVLTWMPAWTVRQRSLVLRGLRRSMTGRLRALLPDVVHVHGEFNPDNWWAPSVFDAPIVLSPHGAFHPAVLSRHGSASKRAYGVLAGRFLYRHVRALHAVSPLEAQHLRSAFPATPVTCVPQGSSLRADRLAGGDERGRPAADSVSFLFVGRLDVGGKGLDVLVDAVAAARSRLNGRAVQLTLVGPDWRGGARVIEERARSLGIEDHVHLTGAVSSEELEQLLPRFDCYVQLSRYEGFGFGVADALAAGKPVILTSTMGIASYPELTALPHVRVVAPGVDAATEALVDVAHRIDELAAAAAGARDAVCSLLSWQHIAAAHRENYAEVISSCA